MRNYVKKTDRTNRVTHENVTKAIKLVKKIHWTITKAANQFEMSERTLSRYLSAMKEVHVEEDLPPFSVGYSKARKHLFLVWLVDE